MDCCKDSNYSLIVKARDIDLIGSKLIDSGILFKEQFELIKHIQGNKPEINLLTFESNSINSITSILTKHNISSFIIRKQFK